jgi:hypothetical protein
MKSDAAETAVGVGLLYLVFASCQWAARDAVSRGKSGGYVYLLALLTWPLGLFIWIIVRPSLRRPARHDLETRPP